MRPALKLDIKPIKAKENQHKKEVKEENNVKKYGQYNTTHPRLKQKVYDFILNEPTRILEPCIGQGHLIEFVLEKMPDVKFDMYEIDPSIRMLECIKKKKVIIGDFLTQKINKKYKTIIGNPPYIKTKTGNVYIDFIMKCFTLLEDNGELIFVVPSDFLKLTSIANVLNDMMKVGSFTHIFHPNSEQLFRNAHIDIMVFRYVKYAKDKMPKSLKTLYNDKSLYLINIGGLITFSETKSKKCKPLGDSFNVYVGMVSGKEQVFKNTKLGNIDIITGDKVVEKYIFIDKYPSGDKNIDKYLFKNKNELIERKIRTFNESNWFEWGAPRNIKVMRENKGKDCIYIHTLTRKQKVAFSGKVDYCGANMIMMIPKEKMDKEKIKKYVDYFNSEMFKMNYLFSGRFKVGHRQLCESQIPIDF